MNLRHILTFAALLILLSASSGLSAQDLSLRQRILMPGPLISGHAELEAECGNCHLSFAKEELSTLCLNCHTEIADDRRLASGFHGISPNAVNSSCEGCHKDHEGRDADITGLVPESFNHSATNFPLDGAHDTLACGSCHLPDLAFSEAETGCIACHGSDDVHLGALGSQCETCHLVDSWLNRLPFDHSSTNFALNGLHEALTCNSCHFGQQFEFASTECVDCHMTVDIHAGSNGTDCASCHSESGWDQVSFNHNDTAFPLFGSHEDTPCLSCHLLGQNRQDAPTTCIGCHASEDKHFGLNGAQCDSCHNSILWSDALFAHNFDTDFLLTGVHQELGCTQCHTTEIHDPLPRDCASCHLVDDVHEDPAMTVCSSCHTTESWNTVSSFDHDFTEFPLIGFHQVAPCASCHINTQFSSAETECVACHAYEDIHEGSLGNGCNQCHTPNAWNIWEFSHTQFTGFLLEGAHENLSCDSCHLAGTQPENTSQTCGACHQDQDIHRGSFGAECSLCHGTSTFSEVLIR